MVGLLLHLVTMSVGHEFLFEFAARPCTDTLTYTYWSMY